MTLPAFWTSLSAAAVLAANGKAVASEPHVVLPPVSYHPALSSSYIYTISPYPVWGV